MKSEIESSTPEYRAEAVKMMIETSRRRGGCADLGIKGHLGNWVTNTGTSIRSVRS